MNNILILLSALLPPALLFLYIWKKDPQKEPTSWLVKAFLWGVAICIPVAFIEMGIKTALFGGGAPSTLFGTTAMAFFVAALPEEVAKLLALWLLLRKNPFFDEHFDGIVYAVCVGLGFAAIENIFYLFGADNWLPVAISRSLLAVPGHYAFAVLMGYFYSVYHFVDHSPKTAAYILLVPVLSHGIYDALAMSGMVNEYVGAIAVLVLIYFCIKMHKRAYRKVVALIEKDYERINESEKLKIAMDEREYTPEWISELKENEIFVFGSNLAGAHGGGAALLAYRKFGAIWGQGVGLQGQSYGIPTMQGGVETIKPYVDEFIRFAKQHPEYKFLVTKIGCGIAGFTEEEIAPLFYHAIDCKNVVLPKEFDDIVQDIHNRFIESFDRDADRTSW